MSTGPRTQRRRAHIEEDHDNHERWLLTYADMITLLMVLFIVMFAISQVDAKKFTELKDGLATSFGSRSVAFTSPGDKVPDQQKENLPLSLGAGVANPEKPEEKALREAIARADRVKQQRNSEEAKRELNNLEEVRKRIIEAATRAGMADQLRFNIDERGLIVTIVTSEVVFAGDRADLLAAGQTMLDAIGPALGPLPNKIEVDGHTNQLPVPTVNYPSAWELSTARASTVVRYFVNRGYVPPSRLLAVGFAGERPLYPPADPRAPALNRRVEIVVLSNVPPEVRALLPSAAGTVRD